MSIARILPWTFLLVLALGAGARAESFDGIYLNGDGGNVAYFDLLRHGDRITGDYTVVVRDPDASGGILRSHFTVTGAIDTHGALLTILGATPSEQAAMSYHWLSRSGNGGFSLEIPLETGRIATPFFRHSTIPGVNTKLADLSQGVDRELHVRLDALALLRAEQALHADLRERLRAFSEVVRASEELNRARNRRQALEATVADLQRESERKHRLADNAGGLDRDRRERLADLQDQANYTDYALATAKTDMTGASQVAASAAQTLEVAKRNLDDHDTRIASLLAMLVRGSAENRAAAPHR